MRASAGLRDVALLAHTATALSVREAWAQGGKMLGRRAESVTIPAAISIAPSQYWDGNDGPWSSFPLQLGGGTVQTQNIRAMVSTAAYNTWAISPGGCPPYYVLDCNNARGFTYNFNDSVTYNPITIYNTQIESNLGLETTGYAGYEDITLGWQGSGGPQVDHSVLFAIEDSLYWIGIFGLNPLPTNFSTLTSPQPSFMQLLANNNSIPSLSYGYTAGNQYRFNKVYGSLTLGGYDQNRFTPTETSFTMNGDISRDLLVNIKSITTDKGSATDLLPDGEISAYMDSTIAEIWLPASACSAFEDAFGLMWNTNFSRYFVNDSLHTTLTDLNPTVQFTLTNGTSDVVIDLPYGAFDLNVTYPNNYNNTNSFYFPLRRAANETQYTLGRTFFQEAFLIADYDRNNFTVAPCAWDQSAVQNTDIKSILSPNNTAIANDRSSNSSSGLSVGAIAGVVIGIVAVIAIIAAVVFFLRRKKRTTKRARLAELEATSATGAPKLADSDSGAENKPFISAPIGGELGGGEIHELAPTQRFHAQELDSPYKADPNKVGYSEMEGGDYYGPGKGVAYEAEGSVPIYEMDGGEVQRPAERGTGNFRGDVAKR